MSKDSEKDSESVRHELVAALTQSSFLQVLGQSNPHARELKDLLKTAELLEYAPGMIIIGEGEKSDRMFFLVSGRVRVTKEDEVLCRMARTGDVFGEVGAITGVERTASVTAETDVTCLATSAPYMKQLIDKGNTVFLHLMYQALTQVLVERLGEANKEIAEKGDSQKRMEAELERLKQMNMQLERENAEFRAEGREHFHLSRRRPTRE